MIHFVIYGLLTAGIVASLVLFLSVKREMQRQSAKHRAHVDELSQKLSEPPAVVEAAYVPVSPRSGLNINRRVHALRMLRRNQDATHIAAALGVPKREVELLIRVQKMGQAV